MTASAVIADVRSLLRGTPVFLAGSLVAEETYGMTDAYSDVDLFCPNMHILISTAQKMIDAGYTFDEKFSRIWVRWLKYGTNKWHTNSLRLMSPAGVETNLVQKSVEGHSTTSLAQVLESFDFGLLATGYDLETDTYRDMRAYLFPGMDPDGPLPLMPNKRENWRSGFISQYNGLREFGRYAKYHAYGYDLSLVQDDLVTGYDMAALYFTNHFDKDKRLLGSIYDVVARRIEGDDIDELVRTAKEIDFKDSLDLIYEALE